MLWGALKSTFIPVKQLETGVDPRVVTGVYFFLSFREGFSHRKSGPAKVDGDIVPVFYRSRITPNPLFEPGLNLRVIISEQLHDIDNLFLCQDG